MKRAKRLLFWVHRWLGVGLSILFVLWFGSGVTMLYVGYPGLTPAERLSHLAPLNGERCCIALTDAWRVLPADQSPDAVTLRRVGSEAVYSFVFGKKTVEVDAVTNAVKTVSAASARRAAEEYFDAAVTEDLGLAAQDVWTRGKAINPHRPLFRFLMNDADNSIAYVSSVTGEVARVATKTERVWNYVGAWLHWLYMFRGDTNEPTWRIVLITLSAFGIFLALTGTIVGIMRWRFRGRHRSGSKSPYRSDYMRWHHIFGLLFALITVSWTVSGLLSMNPLKIFTNKPVVLDTAAYAGKALAPEHFNVEAAQFLAELPDDFAAREIEWRVVDGWTYLIARNERGETRLRPASTAPAHADGPLPRDTIVRAASRLVAGASVVRVEQVDKYDFYYYQPLAHGLFSRTERPLPAIKLEFNDEPETWVYLSEKTGSVVATYNDVARTERWLFMLLHDWDLAALLETRPTWDVLVLVLLLGGLVSSVTGVVIGTRRVRFTLN